MATKNKGKIVAVPTAYNIYRVDEESVMLLTSGLATMPPLVVMETLVMDGVAKLVRQIRMYDPSDFEENEEEGEEGGDGNLVGPWY
jgi:hypothetical protein